MGQPEDLMGAVTFLLSDAAAYVTGGNYFFSASPLFGQIADKMTSRFTSRRRLHCHMIDIHQSKARCLYFGCTFLQILKAYRLWTSVLGWERLTAPSH
jgi:hypothetical protein